LTIILDVANIIKWIYSQQ